MDSLGLTRSLRLGNFFSLLFFLIFFLCNPLQVQGGGELALRRLMRILEEYEELDEELELPEVDPPDWPGLFTDDVGLTGVTLACDDD